MDLGLSIGEANFFLQSRRQCDKLGSYLRWLREQDWSGLIDMPDQIKNT